MRPIAFFLALAAISAAALAEEEKAPPKAKKPDPPPGIWWEKDFEAGLKRAAREGRPVLLAVNALENERANNELAGVTYRSKAWGEATRGYVAFVCNPNNHGGDGTKPCSRYPDGVCASHQKALTWFLKRFGDALISPQHVILEPDGDVAYRKEYYEYVVGPALLESYLSKVAPRTAYARAGIGRPDKIKNFAKVALDQLDAQAADWLDGSDGLAAASILNVLDDCYDDKRRLAIIKALRYCHPLQVPLLVMAAEERVMYPEDEPEETFAWIEALFQADRKTGVWAATRALVRVPDAKARERILRLWANTPKGEKTPWIDSLRENERPAAYEALLLAKDPRTMAASAPLAWRVTQKPRVARARRLAGGVTVTVVGLKDALKKPTSPGHLLTALRLAKPEEIRANADVIARGISEWPWYRARVAGALALLRAKVAKPDSVVPTLLGAIKDPVEGFDARRSAIKILGNDPGEDEGLWREALTAHLEGGAK